MHAPVQPVIPSTAATSAAEVVRFSLASDVPKRMVSVFLGKEVDALFLPKSSELLLWAMSQALPQFVDSAAGQIVYTTELRHNCEERPPNYRAVQLGGKEIRVLTSGWVFIALPDRRVVVYVGQQSTDEGTCPPRVRVYSACDAAGFLRGWWNYARKQNYLRGQTIYANGDPIETSRIYTWDDVILAETVRYELKTHVETFVAQLDRLRAAGLKTRRGIILAGPPGTGKTLIGKVLASTIKATFIWVLPRHLISTEEIAALLAVARFLSPTVLFFEDLDLIGEDRESSRSSLLGELMNQLDGANDNDGIVTIATTNRLEVVERALRNRPGRFDRVVELGLPDAVGRGRLLRRLLMFRHVGELEINKLVRASDGLTPAQIEESVNVGELLSSQHDEFKKDNTNLNIIASIGNSLREANSAFDTNIGFR